MEILEVNSPWPGDHNNNHQANLILMLFSNFKAIVMVYGLSTMVGFHQPLNLFRLNWNIFH